MKLATLGAIVIACLLSAGAAFADNTPAQGNPAPNRPARPRSLQEARERQGLTTTNSTPGMTLREIHGGPVPEGMYSRALFDLLLANINKLVKEGTSGGSGEPTEGRTLTLGFTLHSSGELSDIRVLQSTLPASSTELARRALELSSPLGPWPESLRKKAGGNRLELLMGLESQLVARTR